MSGGGFFFYICRNTGHLASLLPSGGHAGISPAALAAKNGKLKDGFLVLRRI